MDRYKELFNKYISNTCNKEELYDFIDWAKQPENAEILKKLISKDWDSLELNHLNIEPSKSNVETLLLKIQEENSKQSSISFTNTKYKDISAGRLLLRIAAGLAIVISIGLSAFKLGSNSVANSIADLNQVTAPLGSKTQLVLSDGSIIWLNAGSTLEYPSVFSKKSRTVKLTGEGYFEIAKDDKIPFIVKTSDIDIKVLGTKFNLKSYPGEGTIETMLVEGKVSISKTGDHNKENTIELKPNEKATFIKKDGRIIQNNIEDITDQAVKVDPEVNCPRKEQLILSEIKDVEPYTAWKDERLVFKNENFEEVCILMERWYNVKINLHTEELKNYHYTGTLENENIIDAITAFKLTVPFRYDINHDIIDIWPIKKQ